MANPNIGSGTTPHRFLITDRTPPPPQSRREQEYDDALERRAEERADYDNYDLDAEADDAADRWERSMDRMWP